MPVSTHLGVEEGGATVRWHVEVTGEGVEGASGLQLLDGEQESDTLSSGELHSGGSVINAVLLLEINGAIAAHVELARDLNVAQIHKLG